MHVSWGELIFTSRGRSEWKVDRETRPGKRFSNVRNASRTVISMKRTGTDFLLMSSLSFEFADMRLIPSSR